jgi:four helix bundle protein
VLGCWRVRTKGTVLFRGTECAPVQAVGARRVEELVVWQLGNELREKIHQITASGRASQDRRFRDQLRDAASTVTRNVAEGFGRYRHREFAQFLVIARGSLFETADCLRDGVARRYWTGAQVQELLDLCNRTTAAMTHFIRYLKTHADI